MSCDLAHHDGAYVLGALSPADRQEFERHLAGCAECARSVREMAGLPGLLARVDADVLVSPPTADPVPSTLLPALVREVRSTRRRRTFVTAGLAAAAAATIAVGSLAATGALSDDRAPTASSGSSPSSSPTAPVGKAMAPVVRTPVRASLALKSVAWGTRLDLTCSYPADQGRYSKAGAPTYALVVRTRDGRTEQVATWRSLPGRTMRLAAATSARSQDIASVQVRTADGKPVLELAA